MNVPGSPDTDGKVTADGIKTYAQADLGTAAFEDATAFATSIQGGKADTAVQPADLGNSAGLDVGTTAGTVAAGNDSRFTDARTPTAHANSHKHLGSDEIATATPGANAIPKAGADNKLADGWLPAPGTTTLGGVKRNAGTSGQFVKGIDTDGSLIYATPAGGSGGGSTNLFIGAAEMIPRTTNGCGVNSLEASTNKVNYDVLEFDPAAIEYAQFIRVLPNNWNAGTITFKPIWTAASGSGDVVWQLSGRAYANDDAIDQASGTGQTSTDTLLAAGDVHIGPASSAITLGGTAANGNPVIFEISRQATSGSDTLAVDARLLGIEITYTAST